MRRDAKDLAFTFTFTLILILILILFVCLCVCVCLDGKFRLYQSPLCHPIPSHPSNREDRSDPMRRDETGHDKTPSGLTANWPPLYICVTDTDTDTDTDTAGVAKRLSFHFISFRQLPHFLFLFIFLFPFHGGAVRRGAARYDFRSALSH